MRPIKLEVQGFTSFREHSEVDFSKLDLFAITGQTGAGKTSLLDAMTYALYGKTSRLNKAGKDLVSQGATAMSVLLHFRVGTEEYRVARTIKGATVTARLEKRENEEWKPSSGSITDVNEEIRGIVGLDFSGFTKTVILPQGKFDVFLRGEPKERREVLSELLDVDVYQRMVKSANEKAKDAGIRAEERAANIDPEAAEDIKVAKEQRLIGLLESERAGAAACEVLQGALVDALSLREKRTSLSTSQTELGGILAKMEKAQQASVASKAQMETQAAAVKDVDQQIASVSYDADLHLRVNALLPQAERKQQLLEELARDREKQVLQDTQLQSARITVEISRKASDEATRVSADAERARETADAQLLELQAKHGSADAIEQIIADCAGAQAEAQGVPEIRHQIALLEARAREVAIELEEGQEGARLAELQVTATERQYEHLHARDRGAALRHELAAGELCPVCEQAVQNLPPAPPDISELGAAEKHVKQVKVSLKKTQGRLLEIRAEAQSIPGKMEVASGQLAMCQKRVLETTARAHAILGSTAVDPLPSLKALVQQIKAAERSLKDSRTKYELLSAAQVKAATSAQADAHAKQLVETALAQTAQQIASFQRELKTLEDTLENAPTLEALRRQIVALGDAKSSREALEKRRKACAATLKQAEDVIVESDKTLAVHEAQKKTCELAIQALLPDIEKRKRKLKKMLGDISLTGDPDEAAQIQQLESLKRRDLEGVQSEVQACKFTIEDLAKRIAHNSRLQEEVAQLNAQGALYRDLGLWLNAGNFQQYLLGAAFEILANEGSKHLKDLSSGRYEFTFEGDEFLVSDHANADETRSVKTLSGGESFLASLALALALAESITQLNGERGAVNLESLFLDEGFSTLDTETLSRVADAIEVLHNGKRLIGIITHITSLADQMPARIEIEKRTNGSRIIPFGERLLARAGSE